MDEIKSGDEASGDERPNSSECNIECQKVTAKWPAQIAESPLLEDNSSDYTLRDISFNVGPSQVLAIVGQVGSGKVLNCNNYLGYHNLSLSFKIVEFFIEYYSKGIDSFKWTNKNQRQNRIRFSRVLDFFNFYSPKYSLWTRIRCQEIRKSHQSFSIRN